MSTEFTGDVTIRAQGLYDMLREHIADEPAARIVASLQARREDGTLPLPANDHVDAPASIEDDAPGGPIANVFTNVSNGVVARVTSTDETYAHMARLDGRGKWAIAIAEYHAPAFAATWRPATAEECVEAAGVFTKA